MKLVTFTLLVLGLATIAVAKDKNLVSTKITVVSASDSKLMAHGKRLTNSVMTRAIINGDHALLVCGEKHGCQFLGEGEYAAEIKTEKKNSPEVFVHYIRPIDHADFREHWRVTGTW